MESLNNNTSKMNGFLGKYSTIAYRTLIVLASILLMAYFMPREKYESIHFEQGKPWEHEQLIAEFDFEVKKNEKQLAAERDSVKKNLTAYFIYDDARADKMIKNLHKSLRKLGLSVDETNEYADRLEEMYSIGIISDEDAATIANGSYRGCISNSKDNSQTTVRNLKNFTSYTVARDELINISPTRFDSLPDTKDQFFNTLCQSIDPNFTFDREHTEREEQRALGRISNISSSTKSGQRIINNREIVDAEKYRTIETYFEELKKVEESRGAGYRETILYGQLLFITIIMIALLFYIWLYQRDIIASNNKFTFTILAVTIFPVITGITLTTGTTSIYVLPFAMIPALLCLFMNNNIAVVAYTASILICSAMLGSPYKFLILQLMAGMSAILSLKELSSRSQMFKCALITLLAYSVTYLCYVMIKEADITKTSNMMYFYFFISAVLMTLIYPIMLIVEKAFGFVSSVTLIELSNFNSKLLQKLSQETPGTFQHSIQVGNLAAEAANVIGANSLEVRTGALYHDIGKTENPIYFTENQSGGISPHQGMSPIESAKVIIKHVTDGLAIARRENLPKVIQEFITTHHGLSKTGYFYITYKNAHPDEKIDESLFTYPGPQPYTREQAILTMADCVEAASHSLKEYTEENISNLVDNIIDPKVKNGEFSLSPLTFQDIHKIKATFKKRLMAIYHTRISYPTEKKQ